MAAYFYTSPLAGKRRDEETISRFLRPARVDRAKAIARMIMPPFIWKLGKKITGR